MQANVDLYQRQEKRLQEQLHEALKGNEGQVAKWEEKYFSMYDKWQESENKICELKKFEEKHQQMQSLLANLGNFMGSSLTHSSSSSSFHARQESTEKSTRSFNCDPSLPEGSSSSVKSQLSEEKYDLFGMRQPQDKSNPPLFS